MTDEIHLLSRLLNEAARLAPEKHRRDIWAYLIFFLRCSNEVGHESLATDALSFLYPIVLVLRRVITIAATI